MKKITLLIAGIILLLGAGGMMGAEKKSNFPIGTINYIVAFSPGGKTDTQARGIVPYVEKYLGVRFVIQNYPGAGGRIGYTRLFKAKPDGYTVGQFSLPSMILGERLASVEYKTTEFAPIFACFVAPQALVVPADTYQNIDEFVKAGRLKPLSDGTPGYGTSSHLAGLVAANSLGLKEVRYVHFDSSGPSIAALTGKHVDFSITNLPSAVPLVRAGKLKALLVMADEKDSALPQVPIPRELGLKMTTIAGIDGVAGPPNLPLEKVKILAAAFTKAAADPKFLEWSRNTGMDIVPMDHEKLRQATEGMAKEVDKYKDLLIQK